MRRKRTPQGPTDAAPSLGRLTVRVDERTVKCAVPCDAGKCLVAQAIRLLGSDFFAVRVSSDTVRFNYRGWRYC